MTPKKKSSARKTRALDRRGGKAGSRAPGLPGLELDELEGVLEFMDRHGLESLEFARGDLRLALKRSDRLAASGAASPDSAHAASASALGTENPGVVGQPQASAAAVAPAIAEHIIKSPIIGTFYTAASPDAPPFVKVGDQVQKGQVVCIVEAMKLMNEIESEVAGEVLRVIAENGQPVEYGEPLFAIRPQGA
jgi:acetyl-CoA carboxylase biotin carboxyl carrier protein